MVLGHWDADLFNNYNPRCYDSRRNSGNIHQNCYYPRNNYSSNNSTNPQSSSNRNQISPQNQGNYHEYRRNLDQGTNNSSNAPVKRHNENDSVQNRMDVIFSKLPRIQKVLPICQSND